MKHLECILVIVYEVAFSMLIVLKAMHILSAQLWSMSMPLVTVMMCIVLITTINDKE